MPDGWYGPGVTKDYATAHPVELRVGVGQVLTRYVIPAGFEFDVSIPRIPRRFRWVLLVIPKRLQFDRHDQRYLLPAAWHDWFLKHGVDRRFAGVVFWVFLEHGSVSAPRRAGMALLTIAWPWLKRLPGLNRIIATGV